MKHAASIMVILLAALAPVSHSAPSTALKQLFDDEWSWRMRENPLFATSVGDHSGDDRLPTVTVADCERRDRETKEFLKRWESIDRSRLDPTDRVNYDFFGRVLKERIAEAGFRAYLMPITNREGFHTDFPKQVPFSHLA